MKEMNRDQKIALIEAKANEMLKSGEYQFVTILELSDELSYVEDEVAQEEVAHGTNSSKPWE